MLSSMVESGECHTTRSREMVDNAQHGLEKLYEQDSENTIITGELIARERESTKEEIREWLIEEGFEGLAERI